MDQTNARIEAEYQEMLGLCLTSALAARLFGVDPQSVDRPKRQRRLVPG